MPIRFFIIQSQPVNDRYRSFYAVIGFFSIRFLDNSPRVRLLWAAMASTTAQKSSYLICADASKCAGCMTCMLRCSFRLDKTFNLSIARIQVKRLVDHANEFEITFTEECDACGICARYCPYGALIRQKIGRET